MNMEEKNQYIEQYIKNISLQINSQYGKELIDEDKISRALTIFKDSSDDLETEIIPRIREALQQVLINSIKHDFYKQYTTIKRTTDSIGNITEDEIMQLMMNNYSLIKNGNSEDITNLVITEFKSKRNIDFDIDHDTPHLIEKVLNSEETQNLLKNVLSNTSTIGEHNNQIPTGISLGHNILRNSSVIDFITKYLIIHREAFNISDLYQHIGNVNICEMSEEELQQFYNKLLISSIAKRFSIDDVNSIESKQKIYNFIYQNYIENGYCFQGLNGIYKDSTIKNGLSTKFSRQDLSDLEKIDKIFEAYGLDKIFYSKLNEMQLAPYYYITDNMATAYHYSFHNPEWFSYFVASGNDMPDLEYDKTAYYRRDYDACKNNLLKLCTQYNIPKNDTSFIIDKFNVYWKQLIPDNNNCGAIAFVQKKVVNRNNIKSNIIDMEQKDISEIVTDLLKSNYNIDAQFIDIPPENIDVIDAPLLMNFYDKKKIDSTQNQKYIKLENGEKYYYDILIHANSVDFDCISIVDIDNPTMETKNSYYDIPIDIIKCNSNLDKDGLLENGEQSYQKLEMMIAVNGITNSETGKKLIEKAQLDYPVEYMKNYYYHLSQMFCNIANDDNYPANIRASAISRMAKDIYPKAYLMDKTGKFTHFVDEDKKMYSYLSYKQNIMLKQVEEMRRGMNINIEILKEFSSIFKEKLEGKIDDSFTPEFDRQISIMKKKFEEKTLSISNAKQQEQSSQTQIQPVQKPLVQEKPKPFAQRRESEIQVHNQIKEKNQAIKQQKEQKRQMNKPKVKNLTQNPNGSSTGNKGFANVITLSLIVSFVCGALFMVVYMLIKG